MIVWKVSDGCGNVSACTQVLTVRDGKAPTPYCFADIVTVLMEGSESVSIWATDFNLASTDNCTAQDDLVYSFSGESFVPSATFTCADIENGVAQVFDLEMWVMDEAGNQDFCMVQIEIQDNQNLCEDNFNGIVAIEGRIATEDEKEIDDVEVVIETFFPEYPNIDSTDVLGEYSFPTNPASYNYELTATRNTSYLEGVSTLDLILIQDHILSFNEFNSPYKVIAADINDDEKVSSIDIVQLRKLVLGVIDTIPNRSWRFVDSDHEFFDTQEPFPFPEALEYDEVLESIDHADFVAVKIGDVNSSYNPGFNGIGTADTRSDDDYIITIDIDATEMTDRDIELIATQMRPEIYTGETTQIRDLAIQWIDRSMITEYDLYQNEPNPFITETNIGFSLGNDSDVTITIYDATGKVFKTITGKYNAGIHSELISAEGLPASGVLYYKLEAGDYESVRSMIKVE